MTRAPADPAAARARGAELAAALTADGVAGVTVAWCDNNGIPRSRTVPVAALPEVAATGIGVTSLFAVFDTNDVITYEAPGLETPSGDVRLVPQLDRLVRLAGQPALAWAPGRQVGADGEPWPWDQRTVLEGVVDRLAADGTTALVGYELEFVVGLPGEGATVPDGRAAAGSGDDAGDHDDEDEDDDEARGRRKKKGKKGRKKKKDKHRDVEADAGDAEVSGDPAPGTVTLDFVPAHTGPAYSPHALLAIDGFVAQVLRDAEANGLRIGQLHAEYGPAQVELSLAAADPVRAADDQLLARQTVLAAAAAHGLRVSFAPLPTFAGAGNGWHVHTSLWRDGENLLAGGAEGPGTAGAAYVAGLLRDLPGLAAVTAPSVGSLARLRPGFFAGAFGFWGVENREAPLRFVPGSQLLGHDHANVELKVSDASANPYLALAAILTAGAAGVAEGLALPPAVASDPGTWSAQERAEAGIAALPTTPAEQEAALLDAPRVVDALGPEVLGAFLAVRRADASWAAGQAPEAVLAAWRWKY